MELEGVSVSSYAHLASMAMACCATANNLEGQALNPALKSLRPANDLEGFLQLFGQTFTCSYGSDV